MGTALKVKAGRTGSPQAGSGPASRSAYSDPTSKRPRNIILFSDGTGNSSAKLQRTNVWRLYEALDLGYPTTGGNRVQIAFYDNGVGTSSIKLLAVLGGIFGFGLARNIRELYLFLCRNYRHGDRIYAFGFSRGAYTIRLLASFIAAKGVITGLNETQLNLAVHDLWRDYRRAFHTNNQVSDLIVGGLRAVWRKLLEAKRWLSGETLEVKLPQAEQRSWWQEWRDFWKDKRQPCHGPTGKPVQIGEEAGGPTAHYPRIEFLGVWDTVAAYGGPFIELTRAFDEWVWPLSMPNYRLDPKIKVARHALAIDDKRDAFHPLLWDEVQDAEMAEDGLLDETPEASRPRLQQVWFAGMHADVGGGYSDETLSYVSLAWMIEHAEQAGLRLLPELRQRIMTMRNVYGPINNSRGGGGALYRYQPRYINAWLDLDRGKGGGAHVHSATQIYRDPNIDGGRYRTRGLLKAPIRLHISVEERLRLATDGYAPNNLPGRYQVDDGVRGTSPPRGTRHADADQLLMLGDRIKLRRFWYFVTVWLLFALAILPLWPQIPILRGLVGSVDARTDSYLLEAAANSVLPEALHRWTHAVAGDLFTSLILFSLIALTMTLGVSHERVMADIARQEWRRRFGQKVSPVPPPGPWQKPWHDLARWVHKSNKLQGGLATIKWEVVPFVLGLGLFALVSYGTLAAMTQAWLARVESRSLVCSESVPFAEDWRTISASAICTDLPITVKPDTIYTDLPITVKPDTIYKLSVDMDPRPAPPATTIFGRYFRRVVAASHQAPIIVVRRGGQGPLRHALVGESIHMIAPELTEATASNGRKVSVGRFITPKDPALFDGTGRPARFQIFLNEAVLPLDPAPSRADKGCPRLPFNLFNLCDRYDNNTWTYRVQLEEIGQRKD
ncbi:DUF2235 domain-containing protein [Novosphingobium sp.]|uniref:DUF2235 domain-containing protein n=1 Tax=Novosphingobium sp. TaxID=1874826 RepID=UPI002CA87B43|nr:DUF2235 domain-containing protein [Novosphingobium sp.]HQV04921.1 DUF2235 domain-containing protein [Novosphingobium sp.]